MKVFIVGLGLVGGSLALALKKQGLATEVLGAELGEEHQRLALERGLCDRLVSFEEGVESADLTVLATPVDTIPLLAVKALNRINDRQTVIDVGSTKGELCEVISQHARRNRFVAIHPMWGTEYSGPKAAVEGAFVGRTVVICEADKSAEDALQTVQQLFVALGMNPVRMEAEEHDLHAAYVSHISHIT
ncbi:MAG: prephenate dehydrogenase/arogenate dehydrogenase family protein, partial [Alistipes sp.]|nr:prephenate dehydrogenase/arogenate dehydrogenase family protein [Alistipes sp.]